MRMSRENWAEYFVKRRKELLSQNEGLRGMYLAAFETRCGEIKETLRSDLRIAVKTVKHRIRYYYRGKEKVAYTLGKLIEGNELCYKICDTSFEPQNNNNR